MASLIPGYEYDIFISYRQKDNKGDRWVSAFVEALRTELEATFKEDISVYFDINPHDGLLETHDVNASLKEKLKCLIFIPIISRTYCDPKSFAWEHEFKAFVESASNDQFGLKIKLPNGNVASRVLPVQIHDLDQEDKKLVENELGGFLRGIEFIYKESGVNRPLMANEDHPDNNLNKTFYRNQINKVANAIREIISVLKNPIQPEKGFSENNVPGKPSKSINQKTKIISVILIILALIMAGYFIVLKLKKPTQQLEKSIAVLPFVNDSPNDSTTYFINGIMEEILNNLQEIKDFRVLSRTSTDQYKGPNKPTIPEIAKKLDVNFIVEGSGQKYGNTFRLRVQLIKAAKEGHLWAGSYEKEIRETEDIYGTQSEIAESIAAALKATMTPEERQLINKIPTTNLTANDFYQKGREEYLKWNNGDSTALQKAENLYHKSLKYDSTFAQAYSGLAMTYWDKRYWKEYFSKKFMDSVLILTNTALSFDGQLSEAFTLKGRYYSEIGKPEQAIEEYDKAIKLNPNEWMAYFEKGGFYYINSDFVNSINNYQKAVSINHGPELPSLLSQLGWAYFCVGFPDKAKQYYLDKLKLDGDSLSYYDDLAGNEFYLENLNKSIEYEEKAYAIDSTNTNILQKLGMGYEWVGQYKESLKCFKKSEKLKVQGGIDLADMHRIGYAYWQNGYKEKAEYYFNEQIKYCNRAIELKRLYGQNLYSYYDLAGVYAFKGEKDKAFKNLRIFNQIQRVTLWLAMALKTDPLFNSIRNEPEFQQIARDIEAKYQAEHERVRKWLEEQGML